MKSNITQFTNIDFGEIVLCNMIVVYKNEKIKIKNIVYKHVDGKLRRKHVLKTHNIKNVEFVTICKIDIINRLGFDNNNKKNNTN